MLYVIIFHTLEKRKSNQSQMSVVLRKRKNADGTTTLRLDIYHNGQRKIETLKHLKLAKSSNLLDREQNKQRMQQAEEIAVTRAAELEANNYSMVTDAGKKTIITVWMQNISRRQRQTRMKADMFAQGIYIFYATATT